MASACSSLPQAVGRLAPPPACSPASTGGSPSRASRTTTSTPTNVILSPRGPVVVDWANGDLPGRLLGWAFARELPAQLPPAALARRAITTPRPLRIAPSRRIRRTPAATHRFTLLRIRHAAESLLVWSPHPIRLSTDSCEIE